MDPTRTAARLEPCQRRYARRSVAAGRKAALRRAQEALNAAAFLREAWEALHRAQAAWKKARDRLVPSVREMVSRERVWADVVGLSPTVYLPLDDETRNLEDLHAFVLRLLEQVPPPRKRGKRSR